MEAYLPAARPSAALLQPACGDGDQREPQHDADHQEEQQNDIEPFGSGGGLIQRASKNSSWSESESCRFLVALLAYATYAIWQRLPL